MSYRELRNFTEMMRALGYPRLISMENFRQPNFEYEPGLGISDDISTVQDRVNLIRNICSLMLNKARLKLNLRKLYQADGYAVKELLKVATLMFDAQNASQNTPVGATTTSHTTADFSALGGKMEDLREARGLASEVTERGAKLHTLLTKEQEAREERIKVVSQPLDLDGIQRNIQGHITTVSDNIGHMLDNMENLQKDQVNLETKIRKKKAELERHEKRLSNMQTVRPTYMDEYERLESDLKQQYYIYLERIMNLSYIENSVEKLENAEKTRLAEQEKVLQAMQRQLREEYQTMLRSKDIDEITDANGDIDSSDYRKAPDDRPPQRRGKRDADDHDAPVAYGTMDGSDEESEDTGSYTSQSESDRSFRSDDDVGDSTFSDVGVIEDEDNGGFNDNF